MLPRDTNIGLLSPITNNVPPERYGPWERVVYNLLKGLLKAGFTNLHLFATQSAHIPGVRVHYLRTGPYGEGAPDGHAWEVMHIAHSIPIINRSLDILHNHLNYYPVVLSSLIDVPMVTTLHGPPTTDANVITAFNQFAHLPYISISNAERKEAPHLNYIATAYNGIDFDDFSFGEHPEEYLVYTGRMHPDKGVHNAIEFAKQVKRPLHLAGIIPNDQKEYFAREIAPHIETGEVIFHGNLGPQEVHALVSHASAYLGLIEWDEPFGLSIAEALASGTPAIATPRGSHPELVHEGKTGILVSTVEEGVKRFDEVLAMSRKTCRETARSLYSIESSTDQYIAAYEKVLGA